MRKSRQEFFFDMARLIAGRSTCLRRQYGAVIVRDGMVLSVGYNGAPKGAIHCQECPREKNSIAPGTGYEACRSAHAETNAIVQAACNGVTIKGADLYINGIPCFMCAKNIINSGIARVFVEKKAEEQDYYQTTRDILKECGVALIEVVG